MTAARWTSQQLAAKPAKSRPPGETANRITANIIRAINTQPGCVAYRVNNVGVYDEQKGVYRRGNTQKGISDVIACFRGRMAAIEVKSGRDKLSRDQMVFKQEIERAGGLYFEARSTDGFLDWFTEILKRP